jgi:hypothetical protein
MKPINPKGGTTLAMLASRTRHQYPQHLAADHRHALASTSRNDRAASSPWCKDDVNDFVEQCLVRHGGNW